MRSEKNVSVMELIGERVSELFLWGVLDIFNFNLFLPAAKTFLPRQNSDIPQSISNEHIHPEPFFLSILYRASYCSSINLIQSCLTPRSKRKRLKC